LLLTGGEGSEGWWAFTGGAGADYYVPYDIPDTAYSYAGASVAQGLVMPEWYPVNEYSTPTPAPSGSGNYILQTGPYGLKNGKVEYYQHWYPRGGAPTPTPYVLNPTVVNTGYDRVNEIVLDSNGSAYYMAAGGTTGGGFYVSWSETFSDTGEFLSIIVGELDTHWPIATPTPVPVWISEVHGTANEATPCVDWNLRGKCGANDDFFEVSVGDPAVVTPFSVSGWTVEVGQCLYTFGAENLTGPVKVIFADDMIYMTSTPIPTPEGGPTPTSTRTPTPTRSPTPSPTVTPTPT
jgi:hypothetical protein